MPIDRGVIDQQLEELGEGLRWWNERELRDLPGVLQADERLLAISRGKLARVRVSRSWLIVVTNLRLLCLRSGSRARWRQIEVPASQISRVALRIGPFRGRVLVVAGGYKYRLLVPRPESYKLVAALSSIVPVKKAVRGLGATRMVTRIVDHVLSLPAVAFDPGTPALPPAPPDNSANEARLHLLEEQVQQLQQQVDFLEQLLRQKHAQAAPARLEARE